MLGAMARETRECGMKRDVVTRCTDEPRWTPTITEISIIYIYISWKSR
jgi:hypothetical protein